MAGMAAMDKPAWEAKPRPAPSNEGIWRSSQSLEEIGDLAIPSEQL
jgi:hypothetical protein